FLLIPDHPDIPYAFFVVLLALVPLSAVDRCPSVAFFCAAVLGLLSLGKFTPLMLAVTAVVMMTLAMVARGRRGAAVLIVPCYLLAFGMAWLEAGQSRLNIARDRGRG